jgi:predicted protein tyrosine phosphatase
MSDYLMNRLANSTNPYQGRYKKVLCICSAGLLRSPSTALVLSQEPYNYNTRAAGLSKEFALVQVDEVLLHWAQEIVCMSPEQAETLSTLVEDKPIICLNIPDSFEYRDPELLKLIRKQYDSALAVVNETEKPKTKKKKKLDNDF